MQTVQVATVRGPMRFKPRMHGPKSECVVTVDATAVALAFASKSDPTHRVQLETVRPMMTESDGGRR